MFDGWYDKISPETGEKLREWLNTGRDAPAPAPLPAKTVEPPKKTVRDIVRESLIGVTTEEEVHAVAEIPAVKRAFAEAPDSIKNEIGAMLAEAIDRVRDTAEEMEST